MVSHRTTLLWSFAAVTVVLVAGISRIELKENWLKLLDESYEFRRSTDFISKNFTGVETYEYSLGSGQEDGITDVEYLGRVDAFAQWYRAQPEVAHVFAISDIVKRLNKNLHGDNPEFYRLPESSDLAAQYLLLYELSLPVGRDLNNLIDVERSATRVTVVLKSLSTNEKIELDERAQDWFRKNAPDLASRATGVAVVGAHSIQKNIEGMLTGTIAAMGIVSLILLFVFRSVRLGLISLIPNFVPAAMALGLWGYAVGEVGNAAAVVTAIAFGIIVDDTIHFMTKYVSARKNGLLPSESVQSAFHSVGKALLATTVVFALGFLGVRGVGHGDQPGARPARGDDGRHRAAGGLPVPAALADGARRNQGNRRPDQGTAEPVRRIDRRDPIARQVARRGLMRGQGIVLACSKRVRR